MKKSFRGLLEDEGIARIRLSTKQGMIGYKIHKFQIIGEQPGTTNIESTVKIFSVPTTTATNNVDFSDPTLLAAGHYAKGNNTAEVQSDIVVFDNMIINQDIYVTAVETQGSEPTNYYIELERVKLDLNDATVATLKDMRGRE
tara:strand:- start:420 stop:848 length:429 start_codon:yes stop_codon:yes gene_type:complete